MEGEECGGYWLWLEPFSAGPQMYIREREAGGAGEGENIGLKMNKPKQRKYSSHTTNNGLSFFEGGRSSRLGSSNILGAILREGLMKMVTKE